MLRDLHDFEDFLSREIVAFEGSARFARKKGFVRLAMYSQGASEICQVVRSVLRTNFLPEKVRDGDVITTMVALHTRAPDRLKHDIVLLSQ